MPKVALLNVEGNQVGEIELNDAVFGIEPNESVVHEAVVMQMTWPGAPTLYYGDEAGLCGWTDPDNRRTYPWGMENKELIDFHKEIIRIRTYVLLLEKTK